MTKNRLEVIALNCIRHFRSLFSDISFQLESGEMLLIEGHNGAGKSSLLRLIAGLASPYDGEILWQNKSIQEIAIEYRENMHYVGHSNGIKLGLSVIENLNLIKGIQGINSHPNFFYFLSSLQLTAFKNTPAAYLSTGQKRRLALARILLFPKPIWILDEPLTGLDISIQTFFLSQLSHHLKMGGIAIVSSHHSINLEKIAIKLLRLAAC